MTLVCVSLMTRTLSIFPYVCGHLCVLFGESSIQVLCRFLTGPLVFLLLSCRSSLCSFLHFTAVFLKHPLRK